jgi:DNA ligase-associated metallophosphoesterase
MSPMRRSSCGGCRLEVNGTTVVARLSGALWIEAERTLAAGDLHFEKGSAYGARGQLLPPYDTMTTLDRLEAEVEALRPERIVLMGDTFHDRWAEDRLTADVVARLAALAQGRAIVWLAGNHDPEPPRGLTGEVAEDLSVAELLLTHEPHTAPVPGEVAGHLHPVATVAGYGARIRRRCFLTDGRRMILPAFGAYAGGLNVADQAFSGLFDQPPTALILGDERIHAVAWTRLTAAR